MKIPKSEVQNPFVAVFIKDLTRFIQLSGTRELKPRDGTVFLALVARVDWSTGRIRATADMLAEDLQCNPADIRASLARLRKQHYVRWIQDKTDRFYAINPWVVEPANPKSRNYIKHCFMEA
jgi:hypothetical protein